MEKIAEQSQAYSVEQFCAAYGISRPFFYLLRKNGKGPRVMRLGRRVLVTRAAAAEWEKEMESGDSHG